MNKQNILVIEDTPVQIRVLDRILSPSYNIKAATSGTKGIELAHKHPVDLILLDILMEDMSGYDVLTALKESEKTKHIPVIFITSMDTSKDEVKGLSAGAVDYITKPFVEEIVRLRVGLHMQLIDQMLTIKKLSLYDSLTGIRNRRSFNLTMQKEWQKAAENGQCLSMIMLDVDKFKDFNDKYGHLAGDDCLKHVADALKSVRGSDLVFRWGGEEFAVVLPNVSQTDAQQLAERLREQIALKKMTYEGLDNVSVTVSLGVGTTFPLTTVRPEDFCSKVDKVLYLAKKNGRNRVEIMG